MQAPRSTGGRVLQARRAATFTGTVGLGGTGPAFAQMKEKTVTVGGAPMYPSKNIVQNAVNSKDHTTLVAAVQAAQLENVLVNAGPLTVFAPTNQAFTALPPGTVEDLLKPENKSKLAKIVTSHAAPGKFTLEYLKDGDQLYMATGHYVPVEVRDGVTYVNGARILATIDASNGVVHVVDQVFLIAAN